MFQFPEFALSCLYIQQEAVEFPHSDTSGSTHAPNSPKHFAGSHVLHRFWIPRDPLQAFKFLKLFNSIKSIEFHTFFFGEKGIRTPDICLAKAALYQLSYIPKWAILGLNQGPHPYQGCALTN